MKKENLEKALELHEEIIKCKRKKAISKAKFKDDNDVFIRIGGDTFGVETNLPPQDVRDILKSCVFFIDKKIKKLELELKLLGVED